MGDGLSRLPIYLRAAAAAGLLIAGGPLGAYTVWGEELADRELHLAEYLAGVLAALGALAGALLLRQAVVVGGDEQLGVPLHADDGELAQGDVQAVYVAPHHQLLREAGADGGGDLAAAVAGAALAHIHQLHAEDDGVHRLFHLHQVGKCLKCVHIFEFFEDYAHISVLVDADVVNDFAQIHVGHSFQM